MEFNAIRALLDMKYDLMIREYCGGIPINWIMFDVICAQLDNHGELPPPTNSDEPPLYICSLCGYRYIRMQGDLRTVCYQCTHTLNNHDKFVIKL